MPPETKLKSILTKAVFLAIVLVSFVGGVSIGFSNRPEVEKVVNVLHKEADDQTEIDFSPFWKTWNILDEKFVDSHPSSTSIATNTSTSSTKREERLWGAIAGMTEALGDPYTSFLPPEEKKNFEENITGNFGGVGMEIDIKDKILTVVSALQNTPAKQAGIQSGDQIIQIDNQETSGLSITEAVKLIRGPIGTKVKLTVKRSGETEKIITITRANISIPTVDTESKAGVFIIRLYSFNGNSANVFRNALREFLESGTDKLIIDLRSNPGGLLEAAVDMASWFLPVGKPVVIEQHRAGKEDTIYRSYGYDIFTNKLKLAVLIDGGSASASEILAGALSEYGIATLIGEKSFGKGSVQELIEITPDSSLKVTIAKWLTPKHRSLVDNGLEPDIKVENKIGQGNTINSDKLDPVIERAIKFLKDGK